MQDKHLCWPRSPPIFLF